MTTTDPTVTLEEIIAAMGWRVETDESAWEQCHHMEEDAHVLFLYRNVYLRWNGPWNPRGDIAAAMDIVEGLTRVDRSGQRLYFFMTYRPGACWASFGREATAGSMPALKHRLEAEAPTMAEAIYTAACQVVLWGRGAE